MSEPLLPTWCVHYRGTQQDDACKAGVSFDSMKGVPFAERPCFFRNKDRCIACPKQEWPSQETLQKEEDAMHAFMDRIKLVEPIISEIKKAHKGEDWSGERECPSCSGTLRIGHAGCNGHVGIHCTTPDCLHLQE